MRNESAGEDGCPDNHPRADDPSNISVPYRHNWSSEEEHAVQVPFLAKHRSKTNLNTRSEKNFKRSPSSWKDKGQNSNIL